MNPLAVPMDSDLRRRAASWVEDSQDENRAFHECRDCELPTVLTICGRHDPYPLADTVPLLLAEVDRLRKEVDRLASDVALVEAQSEVERLREQIVGTWKDAGPYRLGRWTEVLNHVDPCDCDPDREWVGDNCMENSPWTYAVFTNESEWVRMIIALPRFTPLATDDEVFHRYQDLVDLKGAYDQLKYDAAAEVGRLRIKAGEDPIILCGMCDHPAHEGTCSTWCDDECAEGWE